MTGARGRGWRRRGGWLGGTALLAALALATPAEGRQESRLPVLLTAMAELRGTMPGVRMAIDPSGFCSAQLVGWRCPEPVERAMDALDLFPRGRAFTHVCLGRGPAGCQLVGAEALLLLGDPNIRGNRARVTADLWWRTGRREVPVGHRRVELALERVRSDWRVVETRAQVVPQNGAATTR